MSPPPAQRPRWLVSGAGGQLGRSCLALAARQGVDAVGLTRGELDICDAAAVESALERVEPDVFLNCAAFTKVDLCEERSEEMVCWFQ